MNRKGAHFQPASEQDLVIGYLIRKLCRLPLPSDHVADCDLYGDEEPWQIWSRFRGEDGDEDSDLYFFTPLKKMTETGTKFGRTVGRNGATWRGEDTHSPGQTVDGSVNWERRRYNYLTRENAEKKKKKRKRGEILNQNQNQNQNQIDTTPSDDVWIMHEYRLKDMAIPDLGIDRTAASSCAVCILRRKRNDEKSKKKKKGEGVPYRCVEEVEVDDEDWGDEEDESAMAIVEGKTSGEFDSDFEIGCSTRTDYYTSTFDADFGTSGSTGMEMVNVADGYGVSDGFDVGNFIDFPTNTDHQSSGEFDSNFEIGCFTQTRYAGTVGGDFGTSYGTGMEMINVADGDGFDVANFIDPSANTDHTSTTVGADFGTTMMNVATGDDGGKGKEVLVIPENEGYQFEDFFNGIEDGWLMGEDSAGVSFTLEELLVS